MKAIKIQFPILQQKGLKWQWQLEIKYTRSACKKISLTECCFSWIKFTISSSLFECLYVTRDDPSTTHKSILLKLWHKRKRPRHKVALCIDGAFFFSFSFREHSVIFLRTCQLWQLPWCKSDQHYLTIHQRIRTLTEKGIRCAVHHHRIRSTMSNILQ